MDNKRRNKTDKLHFRDRQVNNKMQKKKIQEKKACKIFGNLDTTWLSRKSRRKKLEK